MDQMNNDDATITIDRDGMSIQEESKGVPNSTKDISRMKESPVKVREADEPMSP